MIQNVKQKAYKQDDVTFITAIVGGDFVLRSGFVMTVLYILSGFQLSH